MLSITIVYKRFAGVYVTIAFKARVVDRCFKRARIHRLLFQFNRDSLVSSLLRFSQLCSGGRIALQIILLVTFLHFFGIPAINRFQARKVILSKSTANLQFEFDHHYI